jgi:cytochrome b involved in lipid metabolism
MKRFMFFCVAAFWGSVLSIWTFAVLAESARQTPARSVTSQVSAESPTKDPTTSGSRVITTAELSGHASPADCWFAIDGVVYDITAYLPSHPTPPQVVTAWCGKDASEAYHTKGYGKPHSPAADQLLDDYRIGALSLTAD